MNGNVRTKGIATLLVLLLALVAAPLARAGDEATAAPTAKRSIAEFVAAQGTYCIDDGAGGCFLIVPPVQNFLGTNDPARDLSAVIDYAGLTNKYIVENGGASLGTRMTGTVTEKRRADGRATVQVVLNTKKAMTWASAGAASFDGPLLFGNRVLDVMAGEPPALCNSAMRVKFINTAPGAPLPDLIQLVIAPEPGQELLSISLQCTARGELHAAFGVPEGTRGLMIDRQNAKVINGVLTFTKEDIILKVLR